MLSTPLYFVTTQIMKHLLFSYSHHHLHLLIEAVNKMYATIESLWPDSKNWLKLCNVKKEDYHGDSFDGNESSKNY